MRTVYRINDALGMLEANGYDIEQGEFVRSGERIFCYELYHQIRIRIHGNHLVPEGILLQGEIKKNQVGDLLDLYGLSRLPKNFIPDFLLHTPGHADDHSYIVEVKDRTINYSLVKADLSKIVEFITRYRYQRGIFLVTNVSMQYLRQTIIRINGIYEIPLIWEVANSIYVVARENAERQCQYCLLSEVLLEG